MAVLLSVPSAVLLASIVHDLAPPSCIKPLELGGTTIVPASNHPVQIDRSGYGLEGDTRTGS